MSHLVLASEEAVKGCVLWVRITGIELPEDSHRVFDAHWYKHEVGDGLSLVVVKAIRGVARAFDDNRMKALGASEDQVRIKRESDLAMKRMTGARIKQWWLEANELRNSGFYVDHKNGKWGRSERVQRKRFEDAFALVGALLAFLQVQVMMNRFSSKEIRRLD